MQVQSQIEIQMANHNNILMIQNAETLINTNTTKKQIFN